MAVGRTRLAVPLGRSLGACFQQLNVELFKDLSRGMKTQNVWIQSANKVEKN